MGRVVAHDYFSSLAHTGDVGVEVPKQPFMLRVHENTGGAFLGIDVRRQIGRRSLDDSAISQE